MTPMFNTDGYKLDHRRQYPKGTERVYSNWTARGSRVRGVHEVVFLGLQYAIKERLEKDFNENFFNLPKEEVVQDYADMLNTYLGPNTIGTEHIAALHDLGYLPLEFKALPEGTRVPLRVPMFTVENTLPEFFWLVNYFETILSATLWLPSTSATNALHIRKLLDEWAVTTGAPLEGVGFQGHDFSMRGMGGLESACMSAAGHLVAFTGTETVPALSWVRKYYPFKDKDHFLAGTVPATEHSVMCAGGEESEMETFDRLLQLYPTGILSVVSDTWDFFGVLTNILPALHTEIMSRDGKLVIRPDSGDPADIICGTAHDLGGGTPEQRGAIELLWDEFGGTVNEKGYKVLDSHVGLIYGDSMNFARINDICRRLEVKGFSTENVVFGLGSYGYQYQTRDTFGFAMKATNVTIDGEEIPIYKDPKTDDGLKRSLKGRIVVYRDANGNISAADDGLAELLREDGRDLLETVWKDGKFIKEWGFDEVRENAHKS
jgi:nicotinamide phosphoribosyltransferase